MAIRSFGKYRTKVFLLLSLFLSFHYCYNYDYDYYYYYYYYHYYTTTIIIHYNYCCQDRNGRQEKGQAKGDGMNWGREGQDRIRQGQCRNEQDRGTRAGKAGQAGARQGKG